MLRSTTSIVYCILLVPLSFVSENTIQARREPRCAEAEGGHAERRGGTRNHEGGIWNTKSRSDTKIAKHEAGVPWEPQVPPVRPPLDARQRVGAARDISYKARRKALRGKSFARGPGRAFAFFALHALRAPSRLRVPDASRTFGYLGRQPAHIGADATLQSAATTDFW